MSFCQKSFFLLKNGNWKRNGLEEKNQFQISSYFHFWKTLNVVVVFKGKCFPKSRCTSLANGKAWEQNYCLSKFVIVLEKEKNFSRFLFVMVTLTFSGVLWWWKMRAGNCTFLPKIINEFFFSSVEFVIDWNGHQYVSVLAVLLNCFGEKCFLLCKRQWVGVKKIKKENSLEKFEGKFYIFSVVFKEIFID